MARQFTTDLGIFIAGIVLFLLGIYLVQDLILKFLKFFIGMLLIVIAIPMILGGFRFRLFRPGRVVRIHR